MFSAFGSRAPTLLNADVDFLHMRGAVFAHFDEPDAAVIAFYC
jgi:hypothetical protein